MERLTDRAVRRGVGRARGRAGPRRCLRGHRRAQGPPRGQPRRAHAAARVRRPHRRRREPLHRGAARRRSRARGRSSRSTRPSRPRSIAGVVAWRANRDNDAVKRSLDELRRVADDRRERHAGHHRPRPRRRHHRASGPACCARCSASTAPRPGWPRPPGSAAAATGCGPWPSAVKALPGGPPRLLVAKPGLDGHSNGAEQIAVAARDAGLEVIYQGIRLTPEQIAAVALDEDVDVIGLSILSGSHLELVPGGRAPVLGSEGVDGPGRGRRDHPRGRPAPAARGRCGRRLHAQGLRAHEDHGRDRRPRRRPSGLTPCNRPGPWRTGRDDEAAPDGALEVDASLLDPSVGPVRPAVLPRRAELAASSPAGACCGRSRSPSSRSSTACPTDPSVAVGPAGRHGDDPGHAAHVRRRRPPARRHLRADARGHARGRRRVGGRAAASLAGHPAGRPGAACRGRLLPGPGAHAHRHRARRAGAFASAREWPQDRIEVAPPTQVSSWSRRPAAHAAPPCGARARTVSRGPASLGVPARAGRRRQGVDRASGSRPGVLLKPGDQALHRDAVHLDDRSRGPRSAGRRRCRPCRRRARRRPGPPRTRRAPRRGCGRRTTSAMRASISSRAAMRPLNVGEVGPVAEADQLHHPAGHRLGRRGHGDPPAVGALPGAARHRVRDARAEPGLQVAAWPRTRRGSGPMHWNSDSSRLTSTTWPTPDHRATIVANAADQGGDLVGERDRRQQRARRRARR